jgi:hypothetical protein
MGVNELLLLRDASASSGRSASTANSARDFCGGWRSGLGGRGGRYIRLVRSANCGKRVARLEL